MSKNVFFNSLIELWISLSSMGKIGFKTFKIPYKKIGKDALGEWFFSNFLYSKLFEIQYFSIFPPEENAITSQAVSFASFKISNVSLVFPETLMITTNVFFFT